MAAENQIFAAAAERSIYTGRTSSALKPVSEGKFAPHPLFLMQAIRPFLIGNERIFVRTWNKQGGFSTKAELPVSRWVPYRGMILSTVVASSALGSGAPASVELYDGNFSGYSVCMRLRRTRQNVNGYPNVQAKDEAF